MKYFRWKDKNTSVSPDFTLSQKLVHLTFFTLKSQNFFIDFLIIIKKNTNQNEIFLLSTLKSFA